METHTQVVAESGDSDQERLVRRRSVVLKKCPVRGCPTLPRKAYQGRAWREANIHRLVDPATRTYAVECEGHHLELQGKRLQCEPGPMSDNPLFIRFRDRLRTSKSGQRFRRRGVTAEAVWEDAHSEDAPAGAREVARAIIRDVMAEYVAELRQRRRHGPPSAKRSAGMSKGQVVRWASQATLALCKLCLLLLEVEPNTTRGTLRRRLHKECWSIWRRTAEFRRELRWRRWRQAEASGGPIDPPIPGWFGRLPTPENITRKYSWMVSRYVREERVTLIAENAGVAQSEVSTGIEDLVTWLPWDWRFVFSRTSKAALFEKCFPLKDRAMPAREITRRENRIRWLARWGMPVETIAQLTGYRLARVREMLGVPAPAPWQRTPRVLRVDGLVVDCQRQVATRGDQSVGLSERECELLVGLMAKPGAVVGQAELAASVWQRDDGPAMESVKVYIGHLRKKLGPGLIETVRGDGYRLVVAPLAQASPPAEPAQSAFWRKRRRPCPVRRPRRARHFARGLDRR